MSPKVCSAVIGEGALDSRWDFQCQQGRPSISLEKVNRNAVLSPTRQGLRGLERDPFERIQLFIAATQEFHLLSIPAGTRAVYATGSKPKMKISSPSS